MEIEETKLEEAFTANAGHRFRRSVAGRVCCCPSAAHVWQLIRARQCSRWTSHGHRTPSSDSSM